MTERINDITSTSATIAATFQITKGSNFGTTRRVYFEALGVGDIRVNSTAIYVNGYGAGQPLLLSPFQIMVYRVIIEVSL